MSLDYRFQNLCGTVHTAGNVIFSKDGNSLFSPVNNRVSVFDLVKCVPMQSKFRTSAALSAGARTSPECLVPRSHSSYTFPCESRKSISRIALSSDGKLLVTVDVGE